VWPGRRDRARGGCVSSAAAEVVLARGHLWRALLLSERGICDPFDVALSERLDALRVALEALEAVE
jgi:hypothetical protein